jgi:hypothetical protein
LGALLDQLRLEYDVILMDASALLTMAHGMQVGKCADIAILTIRHEVSRTMSVFAAQERLHILGVPVLGAVYVEGTSRNLLSGIRPIFKSVASLIGAVRTAGTSAWKRFSNLQPPLPVYQEPASQESQARRAA